MAEFEYVNVTSDKSVKNANSGVLQGIPGILLQ